MKSNKLNLFLVAILSGFLFFTSCKNEKKEELKEEGQELAGDAELAELIALYPPETMAIDVIVDSTSAVDVTSTTTDPKTKAKTSATKKHTVVSGNAFTNKNGDVVGAVYTTVSDQDTVVVHVLQTDTVIQAEKVTKRKFKGIAYVNQKQYTFDNPVTVTKEEKNGVTVDGTLNLTPSGDATETETDSSSDPIQVKIKLRHNGETVKKYKDLVTGATDKEVFNKQGVLIKEKTR